MNRHRILDGVHSEWVRSHQEVWGVPLKSATKDVISRGFDFERLERAVAALVEEHERSQKSALELRTGIRERDDRIRRLEEQLLAANQSRKDVAKRIDELIGQIDQIEAGLQAPEDES